MAGDVSTKLKRDEKGVGEDGGDASASRDASTRECASQGSGKGG